MGSAIRRKLRLSCLFLGHFGLVVTHLGHGTAIVFFYLTLTAACLIEVWEDARLS